jgi:hypothetical protein
MTTPAARTSRRRGQRLPRCGVPTAVAGLRHGEVVLGLGVGVLISVRRVAPAGRPIGLDMTDEMLDLARANADDAPTQPPTNRQHERVRRTFTIRDSGYSTLRLSPDGPYGHHVHGAVAAGERIPVSVRFQNV